MNVSQAAAGAGLAAMNALLDGGTLIFYSGTQPATPETALSGNTEICSFTFAATAFGTPAFASGFMKATAAFVSSSATAVATGNPVTFARASNSGATAELDYTVGTTATDIIVATTNIPTGTTVTLTSLVNQMAAS